MTAHPVHPGSDDFGMAELMAIAMARILATEKETRGGGGANAVIPMAAARLAQLTVAPNLWLSTGGAGSINGKSDRLPLGTWDPRCDRRAECKSYMMDAVDGFLQGHASTERMVRGQGLGSLGGIQIDKYGNSNMIGIGGPHPRLKVRGPGSVGTIWMGSGPTNNFVEHHNKRIFVEKVEYRSGAGWLEGGDARAKALNGRGGPQYAWTPICVCDFTEVEHRMRLISVHPGYSVEDVVANTGFELVIEGEVPTTTPPTEWELNILRNRVDKGGKLRTRRLTVG
jgi:glutaconate CoA-transferase subunit B